MSIHSNQVGPREFVTGAIRNFRRDQESAGQGNSISVITFEIERLDEHGNVLGYVPVEMRGLHVKGILNEGNAVKVAGPWLPGQVLRTSCVWNESLGGAKFEVRNVDSSDLKRLVIFLGIVAIVIIVGATLIRFAAP